MLVYYEPSVVRVMYIAVHLFLWFLPTTVINELSTLLEFFSNKVRIALCKKGMLTSKMAVSRQIFLST